jgi:F0F1-type ATP synthase membrane subunit b/b'
MSDDKGSNWIGPFLLGFLLGVLLCVGAGGTLLMQRQRMLRMEIEAAEADAMMARDMAEREARRAQEQARQAQEEADAARRRARQAEEAARSKKDP